MHNNPQNIDTALYLERWIAVVRGRVVGVGLTARQAHRAAMQTRSKDRPQLFFIDADGTAHLPEPERLMMERLDENPLWRTIVDCLQANQIDAYLVGGAVRDWLLGLESFVDLDFAVPENGLTAARRVADALDGAFYPLDVERGTGRVICQAEGGKVYLDFAAFRGATLRDDLRDRDFTINAIALRLSDPPELIDPCLGQRDLEAGLIRAVADSAFQQDPVRVLRAVRQAVAFDFTIDPATETLLRQAVPDLGQVSVERQRDELVKLLNTPRPGKALQQLRQLEVLPHLLPEVAAMVGVEQAPPHHLDVFDHTATALEAWAAVERAGFPDLSGFKAEVRDYLATPLAGDLTIRAVMPLALLLHDVGKPLTRTEHPQETVRPIRFLGHEAVGAKMTRHLLNRFHFSGQVVSFVAMVVAHHMRPLLLSAEKSVSRRAIYRLFRDTTGRGSEAGLAVALHALADHRATYAPGQGQSEGAALRQVVNRLIEAYFEQRQQVVNPPPLLTGRDLIEQFGLKEGKLIGMLLNRLKEAQAVGHIESREEATAFVKADPDFIKYRQQL